MDGKEWKHCRKSSRWVVSTSTSPPFRYTLVFSQRPFSSFLEMYGQSQLISIVFYPVDPASAGFQGSVMVLSMLDEGNAVDFIYPDFYPRPSTPSDTDLVCQRWKITHWVGYYEFKAQLTNNTFGMLTLGGQGWSSLKLQVTQIQLNSGPFFFNRLIFSSWAWAHRGSDDCRNQSHSDAIKNTQSNNFCFHKPQPTLIF